MHDEQLHALIGATRADGAVDTRRRGRWLRRQLHEDDAFGDVAADVVARAVPVEVWTTGGRTHRGTLVAAGALMTVATEAGIAHIAAGAVVGLRQVAGGPAGDRAAAERRGAHTDGLIDVLGELAEHRAPVAVCTTDGRVHRGVVDAVGRDVVRLGDDVLLRLRQITEVVECR